MKTGSRNPLLTFAMATAMTLALLLHNPMAHASGGGSWNWGSGSSNSRSEEASGVILLLMTLGVAALIYHSRDPDIQGSTSNDHPPGKPEAPAAHSPTSPRRLQPQGEPQPPAQALTPTRPVVDMWARDGGAG